MARKPLRQSDIAILEHYESLEEASARDEEERMGRIVRLLLVSRDHGKVQGDREESAE
ncbi:hypothetical protein [Gorillibacterium sp. CAU 1737]|uniref:hypothetical protein n=1 Tax=Gorillibacterium sp. CAU 1737 TaxID=3140362 RepID=UPI0032618393